MVLAQSHVEPTSLVATAAYGNVSQVSSMWVPVLVPMAVRIEGGVEGQPSQAVRPDDRGKRKSRTCSESVQTHTTISTASRF